MNHIHEINTQCQRLPEDLQKEVLDFIFFLESRYAAKRSRQTNRVLTDAELEQACGILKAPHGVSLAQMEEAIKKRGGTNDCGCPGSQAPALIVMHKCIGNSSYPPGSGYPVPWMANINTSM